MRLVRQATSLACVALLALAGPAASAGEGDAPALGLMGTIPIYWGEADDFGDLLGSEDATPHWAKGQLEERFVLHPLDYLDSASLADYEYLLLAQPRALSGEENVALDAWVRDGGHLLLFADPMMTGHSRYSIADRRRPQDVILLSPILGHWGLDLEFVEDQEFGLLDVPALRGDIPVNLPGRFALVEGDGRCLLSETAVLAQCTIGVGTAVVLADAALLDIASPLAKSRAALTALISVSFGDVGEIRGR